VRPNAKNAAKSAYDIKTEKIKFFENFRIMKKIENCRKILKY